MKESLNSGRTTPIGIIDSEMYEHNNRVYDGVDNGICPAISAREWKDPIKVLVYERYK